MKLSFPVRAARYFRDPLVPTWRKLLGVFAVLYAVLPFDAIPDVIPVLGWLDDIGVLGIVATFLIREINHHRAQPASEVTVEQGANPDGMPRGEDGSPRW